MLNKSKESYGDATSLLYPIIAMTLLSSCYYHYSSSTSMIAYSLSSYDSAQRAETLKTTATIESTSSFSRTLAEQYHVQDSISSNSYLTYKDPIYGIAIQYPSNWKKIEYYNTPVTISGSNLIVNFLAPLANTSDHWRAHLMIQVLKQEQAKKLVPQSEIPIGDRQGFKSLHNSSMQIFNLDRNTESTIHIKAMDVWVTSNNGDTYLLTYKAAIAEYQDYFPTIQRMIDSFRIENSKAVNNYATHLRYG
jgi:hypothetical protein